MKKGMFSNHVSRRDLFLYGGQKSQKTEKSSFVQYSSQSQGEFSQCQDGFNSSCGSTDQLSQGRKMFDSYKTPQNSSNKGLVSLMKPASSMPGVHERPKFQQQFQSNRHKAKENEERELLQTISQSIRDCSEEVQNVVKVLPEHLGDHMQIFGDSLTKIINNSLREQMENVIFTFQEQKDSRKQIHEMKGIIEEKQARIIELQRQLEHQQKVGSDHSVEKVTEVLHRNQESVDRQLQKLTESSHIITENQQRILQGQDHQQRAGHQLHNELQRRLESFPSQVTENRFAEEIRCIRRDLEIQKREAFEFFQDSLSKCNDEQRRDMAKQFENELHRSTNTICNTSNSVANIQREYLQNTLKQQQEELKEYIRSQLMKSRVDKSKDDVLQPVAQKHTDNSQIYRAQCSRSRSDTHLENGKSAVGCVVYHQQNSEQNYRDTQEQNYSLTESKRSESGGKLKAVQQNFMSPKENRYPEQAKTFFQRPNPSPVATVLPQPQGLVQPRIGRTVQRDTRASDEEQLTSRHPGRKSREKTNIPTRRSQRLASSTQESQNSSQDDYVYASQTHEKTQTQSPYSSDESQHHIAPSYAKKPRYDSQSREDVPSLSKTFTHSSMYQTTVNPVYEYRSSTKSNVKPPSENFGEENADVFQFSDENSNSLARRQKGTSSSLNRRHVSQVDNDIEEHLDSSPSVSITKIMIKRKSRKDSPASSVFSNFRTYARSQSRQTSAATPQYKQSENGWKVNRGDVLMQRQASYKRKMMQVDDDLLELSHRIQDQLKRRC
ncbi:putative leucine-rich repeat-containing protein DDB_G0290503 [Magallana gigas]|uniref:putative leucine-rich repeat-containing protein DDB_G0290503 n=1 Tax=Magallana gigas TaxID=29159 RepID=UPI00334203FD